MALPPLLRSVAGVAKAFGGPLGLAASILDSGPGRRRRRRRRRLTQTDLAELSTVKAVLGKTAAANALPFYLGRR